MKNKIVFFGAFDRYNYGDNLMPIILTEFIKKFTPELLNEYEIEYSSISESDLSAYHCYKTIPMSSLLKKLDKNSVIIVVGGDVLCADAPDLFLHVQSSDIKVKLLKLLRRLSSKLYVGFSNGLYSTPWDFPYIPSKNHMPEGAKVIYNTVGGSFKHLRTSDYRKISNRISSSDYVSVRNEDLFEEIKSINTNSVLSPDSVYVIEKLFDDRYFESRVSDRILGLKNDKYIVFQSAPDKVNENLDVVTNKLKKLSSSMGAKVVLLPIGYASGHSDLAISKSIEKISNSEFEVFYDLNVWEIMYVLKECDMYIGTSLHGVITAMSYGKPHFGINEKVEKLDKFLKTWSTKPFNKCYPASQIDKFGLLYDEDMLAEFRTKNEITKKLVIQNNLKIIDKIYE